MCQNNPFFVALDFVPLLYNKPCIYTGDYNLRKI